MHALVTIGILFFVVSSLLSKKNHFSAANSSQLQASNMTINDLLQKDSDGDGVADWQEALWGTDPNKKQTFDGISDSEYISKKKADLKIADNGGTGDNGSFTETDKFAQEFFASLTAMKQNGQVDANTIKNVSTALGQKMVDPTLTDKYTNQDAKIGESEGVDAQKNYYLSIKKLFTDYKKKGIGDEVQITSILADSSSTVDKSQYVDKLSQIADAYQAYATKLIATEVPESLVPYHIDIANSANNTGVAVENMAKMINDPIVGLSGLSQYQKYSDDLVAAVGKLEAILYNNGIIIKSE